MRTFITSYVKELKTCLDRLDVPSVEKIVNMLLAAYEREKTVYIMGNGGAASTASHMACDLGKGTLARVYDEEEKRFRVVALTDNGAILTAFGNDLSFEDIFVQQLRNLVQEGDIVVVMSGSGNSENLIRAVRYARKKGAKTIGFLGFKTGGKLAKLVDCALIAPSMHYGPCEDIQLVLDHVIVSLIAKIKKSHQHNPAVPFHIDT